MLQPIPDLAIFDGTDQKVEGLEGVGHDRQIQGIVVEALVEESHR